MSARRSTDRTRAKRHLTLRQFIALRRKQIAKKMRGPWTAIACLYPTGNLSGLLYDDTPASMKKQRCMDKCGGEKPYGKYIRVKISLLK